MNPWGEGARMMGSLLGGNYITIIESTCAGPWMLALIVESSGTTCVKPWFKSRIWILPWLSAESTHDPFRIKLVMGTPGWPGCIWTELEARLQPKKLPSVWAPIRNPSWLTNLVTGQLEDWVACLTNSFLSSAKV